VNPIRPPLKAIRAVVDCLRKGGVIVYPTDTLYGLGCDIFRKDAIDRVCRIKQVNAQRISLSFVCHDLSDLSRYTKSISTPLFRILKSHLPGAFTFILPASKQVPKILKSKKDTIGLRVPDNDIAREIVKKLGHPILSTSLPGEMVEEYTDPDWIHEKFQNQVEMVVSGGIGSMEPSTVVDLTTQEPRILRNGAGIFNA